MKWTGCNERGPDTATIAELHQTLRANFRTMRPYDGAVEEGAVEVLLIFDAMSFYQIRG